MQLAYEARKARKIIASRDISYAFTNIMANNYYSLREYHFIGVEVSNADTSSGSYDHFCFFCKINNSRRRNTKWQNTSACSRNAWSASSTLTGRKNAQDYERQQAEDCAAFEAAQKARLETAKLEHQIDLGAKRRLSRMLDDYKARRDYCLSKRGEEFANSQR